MTIYEKLSKIQQELKAPKNLRNTFGGYNYRNAEGIQEAFKPFEKVYNVSLILSDRIVQVGDRYYIEATATLFDCEGSEHISVTAYAREAQERKGMDDSQITGSASSYARKYALNGLLLLDDTKDPDTDEYREQQDSKAASSAQKKTIESICKSHGIDVSQLCKLNSLDWKDLTETQAGKLLMSLKRKFGDE